MVKLFQTENEYGNSSLSISEIEPRGQMVQQMIDGRMITLFPLDITKLDKTVKSYLIVEKMSDLDITMVDIVYGNIDLERLEKDTSYKAKILRLLNRASIEYTVRERLGVLVEQEGFANDEYMKRNAALAVRDGMEKMYISGIYTETKIQPLSKKEKEVKTAEKKEPEVLTIVEFWKGMYKCFIHDVLGIKNRSNKNSKGKNPDKDDADKTTSASNNEQDGTIKLINSKRLVYFPSGAVIVDGEVCPKFTYLMGRKECTSHSEMTAPIDFVQDCFCTSGVDLERLQESKSYRDIFSKALLTSKIVEALRYLRINTKAIFTYTGRFSSSGRFETDKSVSDVLNGVNKLQNQERNV